MSFFRRRLTSTPNQELYRENELSETVRKLHEETNDILELIRRRKEDSLLRRILRGKDDERS